MAANEIIHQHRHQGDGQTSGGRHGVGFGECQWREQLAFLGFQSEHRQETQRDNQQREKQRGSHFRRCTAHDFPATDLLLQDLLALQMFVGVFHHNNSRIHHGTHGDGNAAQGHDIRVDALPVHDDKRGQDTQRQNHDGH